MLLTSSELTWQYNLLMYEQLLFKFGGLLYIQMYINSMIRFLVSYDLQRNKMIPIDKIHLYYPVYTSTQAPCPPMAGVAKAPFA